MAARVLHAPGSCLQVDQFEWRHPVLNLHVLGTIMVDAGSRAASVTIHRVMDVAHGLGNVTGEIMLATLLNHCVKYCVKPDIVRTDPEGACRDQGFRRGLAAKSIRLDIDPLGKRHGKQEFLGKPLIQSNRQQFVWLEELLTVSQFKKCWMTALLLTTTCIQIDRQASRFVKILILLSAVLKLWTRLQCSVSERRKSLTKCTSKRSCLAENAAKKFIKPDLKSIAQPGNGVRTGDLANTSVRE